MIFWFYIKIFHNCKKISAETLRIYDLCHCLKSVRIRSFSGPYFAAFRLNREINSVNLHIQSECEKMRTRKTPNTDTFYVVYLGHKQRKIRQSFAELIEYKCCNFTIVTVFLKICSHCGKLYFLYKVGKSCQFYFRAMFQNLFKTTIFLQSGFPSWILFLHGFTDQYEREGTSLFLPIPSIHSKELRHVSLCLRDLPTLSLEIYPRLRNHIWLSINSILLVVAKSIFRTHSNIYDRSNS